MEQTDIYDYLGIENDPIFNIINHLKAGQAIDLGGVIISLNNNGLYEMETLVAHECFSSKRKIYDVVSRF